MLCKRADYPVYHSTFDNYNWMTKFGDPLFHRHVAGKRIPFILFGAFKIIGNTLDSTTLANCTFWFTLTAGFIHENEIGKLVWHFHYAVTSVWGLLALRLADDEILPMKYEAYAKELHSYALEINSEFLSSNAPESVSIAPLFSSIKGLQASTHQLAQEVEVILHSCLVVRDTTIFWIWCGVRVVVS